MFTTILAAISGLFSKNKSSFILAGLILLFAGISYYEYKSNSALKVQLKYANQNILAAKDSIRIVQTKDKKEEADKLAYVVTQVSQLQTLNDSLYKEVKNTVGSVSTIVDTKIKVVHDTVKLNTISSISDSTIHITFDYSKVYSEGNFRAISGYTDYNLGTKLSSGLLTTDSFGIHLITGIKNINIGKPEIFIRSDYPGFSATSIDGAVLSLSLFAKQKPARRIGIGANISYSPLSYNLTSKKFSIVNQATAGVGIYYRIW